MAGSRNVLILRALAQHERPVPAGLDPALLPRALAERPSGGALLDPGAHTKETYLAQALRTQLARAGEPRLLGAQKSGDGGGLQAVGRRRGAPPERRPVDVRLVAGPAAVVLLLVADVP